jgi:predicted DNA-binding protein (MmcQ/YjbR family)
MDGRELRQRLADSYELVRASLPKKTREGLAG